jgi:uncharacterized RDD family membrane protein YckC
MDSSNTPSTSAEQTAAAAMPEYVGFWARVGAAIIDSIAALVLLGILATIFGLDSVEFNGDVNALLANPQFARGQLIEHLFIAALVVACWIRFAATPGKRVIGAEVVDATTFGRLTTGQAVLRYLCYYVATIPFFLGLIWVGIDKRKQGWHDKIAGTVVIKKR